MNYKTNSYFTQNSYGGQLYVQDQIPLAPHKATLCLIHGIGEHSNRYEQLINACCKSGIAVNSFDLRGHGLSEGKRGTINSIDDYWDDLELAMVHSQLFNPNIPCFLYGHSMGGNIALGYVANRPHPFKAVIASSPWLGLSKPPGAAVNWVATHFDAILPHLTFRNGIKAKQLVTGSEQLALRKKDKLLHPFISIRLYNQLQSSALKLMANPEQVKIPSLLLHGEKDAVTNPRSSKEFAGKATNSCFIGYANAIHELHNGPDAQIVFNDIVNWIFKQLNANDKL